MRAGHVTTCVNSLSWHSTSCTSPVERFSQSCFNLRPDLTCRALKSRWMKSWKNVMYIDRLKATKALDFRYSHFFATGPTEHLHTSSVSHALHKSKVGVLIASLGSTSTHPKDSRQTPTGQAKCTTITGIMSFAQWIAKLTVGSRVNCLVLRFQGLLRGRTSCKMRKSGLWSSCGEDIWWNTSPARNLCTSTPKSFDSIWMYLIVIVWLIYWWYIEGTVN